MVRRWLAWTAAVGVASGSVLTASTLLAAPAERDAVPGSGIDREQVAETLLAHHRDRFATPALTRALDIAVGRRSSPGRSLVGEDERPAAKGTAPSLPRAHLRNVRVNAPAADRHQVDQTTQSETSVAVAGSRVAVAFNDSQQALFALTDGFDLSGYGYSRDGGRTFTDGGTLPNPTAYVNLGDPWLGADRAGRMYYSTLTLGGAVGNLEVAVGRSDDGGRTWSTPTFASPHDESQFYLGDKDALAVGRDPVAAGRDNVYVAWDDFVEGPSGSASTGLPVARSTDHGRTWTLHDVDRLTSDVDSCSFAQYIGAQPVVDPADGTLYVAAEKASVDDPRCEGGTERLSIVVARSTDAGTTFSRPRTVASVTAASPTGALELGPGQVVRTVEFPTMAVHDGDLWVAWNDGRSGRSHLRLARSGDGGRTWSDRAVTRGSGDEIQPALSADRRGLHLAYYQRNPDDTLDTVLADSWDGVRFRPVRVTTRSFPGVQTVPQFDPQIAFGYMGDYIANVSAGGHLYLAWGDNRDRVRNFMHPQGRHDPDVFLARR